MEKGIYTPDYRRAQYLAIKNQHVRTREELRICTKALYEAIRWGKKKS